MMQDYRQMPYVDQFPIAMAYVPWQQNCNMYENLDEAFRVLNKPFKGGEKCR